MEGTRDEKCGRVGVEAKGLSTITQQWRSDIRGTLRSAEEASRCNTIPRAVSEGDAGRGSDSGGKGQARKGPLRMYFHWGCVCVTKRRSSWACVSNPKLEQETIEGTQAQETPAYKRRPTTPVSYTHLTLPTICSV